MAVNITKTEHFTSGAGNPISFSQIRSEYGGSTTNIKASTYLRNDDSEVDWDDESTITSRIPDATENADVASESNWTVDSLRDTITSYLVTQSGSDEELSYSDSNTDTWNNNLSKNVPKTFDVTGTVFANNVNDDALSFSGNLFNLDIEVDEDGEIYGEGGTGNGGNGGDALYVNNTNTKSKVEIRSYGKIWSGGGAGTSGASGNSGSELTCAGSTQITRNVTHSGQTGSGKSACSSGETELSRNPNGVRNRCRGGGARKGQLGGWNSSNKTGYHCGNGSTSVCQSTFKYNAAGGAGGNGGAGGPGRGYSYQSGSLAGGSGNSGGSNSCGGSTSTGNSGSDGNAGGEWGQSSGGSAGRAVLKKNAKVTYYTDDTLKGPIQDI